MALTTLTADLNIIQKLSKTPSDGTAGSAAALQEDFDEAGNTIKTFINETLIPEITAEIAAIVIDGGGGAVDSVNGATGVVVLDSDDILDTDKTHKFVAAADLTKLGNLSGTNTGDQDLSGYSLTSHNHTGAYAPALGADDNYVTDAQKTVIASTTASYTTAEASKLAGIETGATADMTGAEIRSTLGVSTLSGSNTGDQTLPTDATLTTTDVTTNNASTTKHGFLLKATAPASGLYNYVGITNGETVYSNKAWFDATAPSTQAAGDTAATGSAATAARRDHKHAMPAALVSAIAFVIDGGGSAIATGVKGDLTIPFACTVQSAVLLADQSGSIVVDIWKDTYVNYPPTVADTITASAKPTLSTATKSENTTLTGWTTVVSAGDILRFNVDSATTVQRVTLSLKVVRT